MAKTYEIQNYLNGVFAPTSGVKPFQATTEYQACRVFDKYIYENLPSDVMRSRLVELTIDEQGSYTGIILIKEMDKTPKTDDIEDPIMEMVPKIVLPIIMVCVLGGLAFAYYKGWWKPGQFLSWLKTGMGGTKDVVIEAKDITKEVITEVVSK